MCTLSLDGEHNGPTSTARTEYDQCADTHTARDEGRTEGEDYTKATNRRRLAYARRSGKKRSRPIHRQTPGPKRRLKRLRFTALPSSSEESENNDSDISTYTAPKSSKTSMTGPEADEQSRRSPTRTAVVYQQQSWEGVIMDEKYTKQGRGRPRKQYLIQWEPSWVDAAHLNAPELTRNWNEKVIWALNQCLCRSINYWFVFAYLFSGDWIVISSNSRIWFFLVCNSWVRNPKLGKPFLSFFSWIKFHNHS